MEEKKKISTYDEILNHIVYLSRAKGNPIAEAYVAFLLNIQYDKTNKKFYFEDSSLSEERANEVIEKVLNILEAKRDGIAETLKLQISYELSHIQEEDKLTKIKEYFDKELSKITREITQNQYNKKDSENFLIHKKIFNYLLIKTKQNTLNSLIHSTDDSLGINAEKEIYLSLGEVLPKSGLSSFLSLSSQDKIAQLNELSNIVMGIRLLNCEIGKGGIGLMTLEEIKKKLKFDLLEKVQKYNSKIKTTCEKYSLIYDNMELDIITEENELRVLEKIKKLIVYYRQISVYLSMLIDNLNYSIEQKKIYIQEYEEEKNKLISIVHNQSSMSKEACYPLFQKLAQNYIKFQEQVFILESRENVFNKLVDFIEGKDVKEENKKDIINLEYNKEEWEGCFEVDVEKLDTYEKSGEPVFSFEKGEYPNGITIIPADQSDEFKNINLEYQGFCIHTLLQKNGLLITGIPAIAVKYKEKYMVFCCHQCVQKFIDNPQEYINQLNEYVKENPHLINLLHMVEEFPNGNLSDMFRDKDSLSFKYRAKKVLIDNGTQTVDHIYEKGYIDVDYVWNEWDLKKKALQLADIMKKKTVSCQTLLSHFRRDNETQVWPLKERGVNTTVNKGTNLSIPKSYAVGFKVNSKKY